MSMSMETTGDEAGNEPVTDGREFWRGVLTAGGFTAIPRWTLDPAPGFAVHQEPMPGDLVSAARRRAQALALPFGSLLLAVHAKVLAALSGEREVTTGYLAGQGAAALPCHLTTEPGSWRALALQTRRTEAALLAHQHVPLDGLRRELGLTELPFETIFSPAGDIGELAQGAVLGVGIVESGGQFALRVRYRTEALDADCAARIAGYHLTALALLAADPDAGHRHQSLLSAAEHRFQTEGLAGPHRELPDRRAHEVFEQRVREHPDAVAAAHGTRQWTYRELNCRANRLGRALLARGLGREDVVAVVTERNLDWMAAVLAVLKAGGVYLPIEPHFPAERIAAMLSRAECGFVLTETGSTTALDQALKTVPATQVLSIVPAYEEDHGEGHGADHGEFRAEDDLELAIAPDQLAYIYFTSGSTGEPKGAMCEHAGMLNHLYAKIDDLGIGAGQVVAQTAPQCFDISLWQLVSALLVGGRTLLVDQEVILDAQRFVETIADGRVGVLQVVPSYLEAVVTHLERHPRALPDLQCVSVTGEALKKELTQRWFAAQPAIKLVNAYGLTETSDDTNHEVMDRPPDGDRVPLGPPVSNVHLYVVDEHLSPVPLGAPGEIVFSGICVGRGYVNDPERTRPAFLTDPHRAGRRLYRSGDHGRWRPDGKLDFLGRRDTQVKVRGFRIEIGEIENALLRVPGVRDGAVVVAERTGRSAHLVAFYCSQRPVDIEELRNHLGASLPAYMVPSAFHRQTSLLLTANGKTDRRALTALASQLDDAKDDGLTHTHAPRTPTEQRLAQAWAKVLGVPQEQIGRHHHFFDRGGTSLSAVKLAISLDRAVSLKDITRHPVLADLAGHIDGRSQPPRRLLRSLSPPDGAPPVGVLVCFPSPGDSAAGFEPVAKALHGSGMAVYGVELPPYAVEPPGQEPAPGADPRPSPAQVAEQAVTEIAAISEVSGISEAARRGPDGIVLWGHSSGIAYALETVRQLQARGIPVQRVFLDASDGTPPAQNPSVPLTVTIAADAPNAAHTVLRAAGLPASPANPG